MLDITQAAVLCNIKENNDTTLRKWQKPEFRTQFGALEIFFMGFTSTSS